MKRSRLQGHALVLFFLILIALSSAIAAEASFINLSGELEISYGWSRDTQGGKIIKETSDFQQRYNLRNYGELWDPSIGTFTLSGTFLNQDIQTRGETVSGQNNYNNLRLLDYSGSVSLMPRIAPLTFSAQQITQYNAAGSCYFFCSGSTTQKDHTTNYNLNWLIPLDHLPTIRLNLNQLEQKSNAGLFSNPPTDITTRFANVEVSERFGDINVMLRYQFAQTEFEGQPTTSGNAINLNIDGKLTEALSISAAGDFTNQGGVNTAQSSFVQERGGNVSLYYRPSRYWDGSLSYDMSESPGGVVDFKRETVQGSLNVRPTTSVDLFGNYRFMRFESGASTDSNFGTGGFNWRDIGGIFGLMTGASVSYGVTDVSGGTNSQYYNGNWRINYTKTLFDQYRLNTGYNGSYGVTRTTPVSPVPLPPSTTTPNSSHKDFLNAVNASLENINVRIIHWLVSYSFTDTHQNGDTIQTQDDQRAHVAQINIDSNIITNLLLQASASYTNIEGFGTQGGTLQLDGRANYFMSQGLSLMAEINHQDFPHGVFGDSTTFTGDAMWVNTIWQRLSLLLDVKEIYQLNESTSDRQTLQGQAQATYQLGKLLLTMSYLFIRDEGIGQASPLNSQNFFVRAVRSF
jgi:hypothetical protein